MSDGAAWPASLWLVGCGNMGGAMLRRWLAAGLAPEAVTVLDPHVEGLPAGVTVLGEAQAAAPDLLVLAVKPQQLEAVAAALAPVMPRAVLSILAGVEEVTLARHFPDSAIVRAMPNLPVGIGKGVVALHAASANAPRATIERMMASLGLVEWLADESLFDAVTALSGSGPGFTYRFIDALAKAGAALGIPAEQAARFAIATVEGSALLAAEADAPPAELADRVASKGGSTREGLNVLDREDALTVLLTETLEAARRRNVELAAAARQ